MTNDLTPEENLISKKATFHKFCKVHITLRSGHWENGVIDEVGAEYLILEFINPEAIARWKTKKRPFFFMEIQDIEEYNEVGK